MRSSQTIYPRSQQTQLTRTALLPAVDVGDGVVALGREVEVAVAAEPLSEIRQRT
jgi:hypothetical protein